MPEKPIKEQGSSENVSLHQEGKGSLKDVTERLGLTYDPNESAGGGTILDGDEVVGQYNYPAKGKGVAILPTELADKLEDAPDSTA